MLKSVIDIFRIRREERKSAAISLLCFIVLNALNIIRYFGSLSGVDSNTWSKFIRGWHIAGFDPITYSVLTEWTIGYNVHRHPLLPYFMWPLSKLNGLLTAVFGVNMAMIVAAFLIIFCAFYSYIFISRIFCDVIGLKRWESNVLSVLTFSFAYVMIAALVPDHFILSMFCLTLTLYLSGMKLKRGSALNLWQTIVMFFFTAGISLNNGLKIFLAALVTRRKRFFEWKFLLLGVILPSALIWESALWSYKTFVWPKAVARNARAATVRNARIEKVKASVRDTMKNRDSSEVEAAVKNAVKEYKLNEVRKRHRSASYRHKGKPIANGEFSNWTDISTSRIDVAVECLFGEGIMLHENYLLGDVLVNRPVIVHYKNWGNYIVEAFLVLLFLLGIWCGRYSRFMWTAMSFFMLDMVLHMGLGFAINEISIMSAHYMMVMPIAMAYLLKALPAVWRRRLAVTIGVVAAYLVIWNVTLLVEYLYIL